MLEKEEQSVRDRIHGVCPTRLEANPNESSREPLVRGIESTIHRRISRHNR